jgi:hypothetical protein
MESVNRLTFDLREERRRCALFKLKFSIPAINKKKKKR